MTKLLVIEDNPGDARLIQIYLEEAELAYELAHADSLAKGLKHLSKNTIDLVMVDLGLPDSHGLESFNKIKAQYPDIPIMILTGLDDSKVALEAVEAGAQDYLIKAEINGSLLSRSIQYAIERKHAEKQLRENEERYREIASLLSDFAYSSFVDEDGNLTREWVVGDYEQVTGYTPDEGGKIEGLKGMILPEDRPAAQEHLDTLLAGNQNISHFKIARKDGETRWLTDHGFPVNDPASGRVVRIIGGVKDSTESRRLVEAEKLLNKRIQMSLSAGNLAWWELNLDTEEYLFDDRKAQMLGYEPANFNTFEDYNALIHPDDQASVAGFYQNLLAESEEYYEIDYRIKAADGSYTWLQETGSVTRRDEDGAPAQFVGLVQDITEKKRSQILNQARLELQNFAENHEFNEVLVKALDMLCQQTESMIGFYHFVHEETESLTLGAWSSRTTEEFCQLQVEQMHYPIKEAGVWVEAFRSRKPVLHNDYGTLPNKNGLPEGHAEITRQMVAPVFQEDKIVALVGVGNKESLYSRSDLDLLREYANFTWEIIEKMRTQAQLERNLLEQQILYEASFFGFRTEDEDELITFVTKILSDDLFTDHLGFLLLDEEKDEIYVHPTYLGIAEEEKQRVFIPGKGIVGQVIESGKRIRIDDTRESPDYIPGSETEMLSELCVPIVIEGKPIGAINTESRRTMYFSARDEQFLATVANEVSVALEKMRLFKREQQRRIEAELAQNVSAAITSIADLEPLLEIIYDHLQRYLEFDSSTIFIQENGYLNAIAMRGFDEAITEQMKGMRVPSGGLLFDEISATKSPLILEDASKDERFLDFGDLGVIKGWMGVPLIEKGEIIGFFTFDSTIPGHFSEEKSSLAQMLVNQTTGAIIRANLHDQTTARLNRLQALHEIDKVITSNLDIMMSFDSILEIICSNLDIDAASILTLDYDTNTLRYGSKKGFETSALEFTNLPLGKGYAGIAAQEMKSIYIPDLGAESSAFAAYPNFKKENFKTYYCIPMISKDEVKGVLELFHRSIFHVNTEWEEFIRSLAAQIAIVVENSTLFEGIEKANLELSLGYDATLEGWAKTLELRDQETEGHSQRVVSLTVRLARKLGLNPVEIIHARRGALLHDIGKIGIPDSILQKPGKLDDEEWETMKQHTIYAYNALKDIEFLKPALAIPYSHHEKWDGSGYPQGLEGEQIPIAARIFAIIDVYDALGSDRPYRDAWSDEKIIDYISKQSGLHFDPKVVDAFVEMIEERAALSS